MPERPWESRTEAPLTILKDPEHSMIKPQK